MTYIWVYPVWQCRNPLIHYCMQDYIMELTVIMTIMGVGFGWPFCVPPALPLQNSFLYISSHNLFIWYGWYEWGLACFYRARLGAGVLSTLVVYAWGDSAPDTSSNPQVHSSNVNAEWELFGIRVWSILTWLTWKLKKEASSAVRLTFTY